MQPSGKVSVIFAWTTKYSSDVSSLLPRIPSLLAHLHLEVNTDRYDCLFFSLLWPPMFSKILFYCYLQSETSIILNKHLQVLTVLGWKNPLSIRTQFGRSSSNLQTLFKLLNHIQPVCTCSWTLFKISGLNSPVS